MANTTANEVFDSFESSFQDKCLIPSDLELVWLKNAVARYSIEYEDISFDENTMEFGSTLSQYTIATLGQFMKVLYQEREWSKVNKRVSISGKDFGIDATGSQKTAARYELEYNSDKSKEMIEHLKTTAYV